ncbi:hypothetical protein O0L34_g1087 [Tuta absoluta]|nr:hypothetical protein O0L34_g1087 [Tuta absoluta]
MERDAPVGPAFKHRTCQPISADDSSPSSEEEGTASQPPNKRRKMSLRDPQVDPRVDALMNQVSYLTNYLTQLPKIIACNSSQGACEGSGPSTLTQQNTENSKNQFFENPCARSEILSLGTLNIDFDEHKIIRPANKKRLEELSRLQQFNSPAWKGIRYKKPLQAHLATPGFIALKINEEFCHLNKTKDYLALSEQFLAGMSNALLEHREILKSGLQNIIDWASANSNSLNINTLFVKVTTNFGPGSRSYCNSENLMKLVCGKRAECIEIRRERILKEMNNPNLKAMLQNIPPSPEYLFSREALSPIIQSLGGAQSWLSVPAYLKEKRPSSASFRDFRDGPGSKKPERMYNKNRQDKKPKFSTKKNQPFRRGGATNPATYTTNKNK